MLILHLFLMNSACIMNITRIILFAHYYKFEELAVIIHSLKTTQVVIIITFIITITRKF